MSSSFFIPIIIDLIVMSLLIFLARIYNRNKKQEPILFKDFLGPDYIKSNQLVSHRGYGKRGVIAENSLDAIREATLSGFIIHEFDVRVSKDNQVVLFHGRDLSTTTDGKGRLEKFEYNHLRQLNWGSYLGTTHVPITLLETVLEQFSKANIFNVEIKRDWFDFKNKESLVIRLLEKFQIEKKTIISSFNIRSLLHIRKVAPHIKLGALLEPGVLLQIRLLIFKIFLKPQFFHLPKGAANKFLVEKLKKEGFGIMVYTVNDLNEVKHLKDLGVELIVTDNISGLKSST